MRREGERKQLRHDRKQYNAHNKMVMEELAPKADPGSHAARREKRQMKGSYARNNQDNGGMADMREGDLMGSSGGSEYKRMLAKRAQRRDAKTHAKNERLEAYKQKEADTMKAFMNSMGLQEKFNM